MWGACNEPQKLGYHPCNYAEKHPLATGTAAQKKLGRKRQLFMGYDERG